MAKSINIILILQKRINVYNLWNEFTIFTDIQ